MHSLMRHAYSANIAQAASDESIPPALLTRARSIAVEHKSLSEKLANGFDTRVAKKLGEYSPIVNALQQWDKANEVCDFEEPEDSTY
jgi:peptide chain release factor 1